MIFMLFLYKNQRTLHLSGKDMLKSVVIEEKKLNNIEYEWFGIRSMNDSDLWYSKLHVLIKLTASTNFYIIDYNSYWKINCFNFFPYKSIGDQIWPCHKIGQGQPRGIIWTNCVALEYSMLPYQVSRSSAFQFQRRIFKGFYHIWAWRQSWSCDLDHLNQPLFLHLKEAPHKIWLQLA